MPLLSLRAYARHRGCSPSTVHEALESGRIVREPDGRIDSAKADRMWALRTRAQTSGGALGEEFQKVRLARALLSVKLGDLEYRERSGGLVDVDEVRRVASERARKLRDLLRPLPERLGPVVAGLSDAGDCVRAIEAEVYRILDEMARPVDSRTA